MENGAESAVPQEGAPSPGAILAAERERQGLSRADIAQRLHMSVLQIEALEIGDYERLPRGPFLRGFARNYARVLGIDPGAIVGMLTGSAPPESAPRIVVPTQNIRFDPLGTRLSSPYVKAAGYAAVAIVLGFAAMYWWLFVRPQGQVAVPARKPVAATPAVTVPAPEPPAGGAAPDGPPKPPAGPLPAPPNALAAPLSSPAAASGVSLPPHPEPAPVREAAKGAPAPASPAPKAPVPAPALPAPSAAAARPIPGPADPPSAVPTGDSGGVIRMKFDGAAWVEVKDARGRTLLSKNQPGGSDAEVVGKPPLTVVIGNAAGVRLTYNDRAVDLEPHTRVSVARLTLP